MTDYPLSRDFKASEFICHHCGATGIKQEFVEVLQGLRDAVGRPVVIVSGYRCARHPLESVKGKPGVHVQGIAADLYVPGMTPRDLYLLVLRDFPVITGIGAGRDKNTLHLDTRSIPKGQRAVVWGYDAKNNAVRWNGRWEELPI